MEIGYRDVKGQRHAVPALDIAAAGGHNLLMGPPGSSKTMLGQRLPTILPPLGLEEAIQVTRVHSAAGQKGNGTALVWSGRSVRRTIPLRTRRWWAGEES